MLQLDRPKPCFHLPPFKKKKKEERKYNYHLAIPPVAGRTSPHVSLSFPFFLLFLCQTTCVSVCVCLSRTPHKLQAATANKEKKRATVHPSQYTECVLSTVAALQSSSPSTYVPPSPHTRTHTHTKEKKVRCHESGLDVSSFELIRPRITELRILDSVDPLPLCHSPITSFSSLLSAVESTHIVFFFFFRAVL